jgi:hypothetical protein
MADTTTTTYSLTKPEVGASADTWGTKINTNLDTLDNLLDGGVQISPDLTDLEIDGVIVTATPAELNILDGVTSTAAELNILDGVTATAAELNYTDGVTSNIQTQLDAKTDTTYSAGSGLDISGTTFSVEPDLRDGITHVGYDAGDYIYFDNSVIDFHCNSAHRARLANNGDFHADGDVIAYSTTISDERLKENIQPIEDALSKVNQLNGCTFTYTTDGKESAGLIAQDVEKVLPSAVTEKELPLKVDDGEKYKVLQYDQTIGLLVEAIKELSAKVEQLEG